MAALSELKAMSVIIVIASMLSVHSLGGSVQASSGWAGVEALLMDYGTPSMIPKKTSSDDLALRGQSLVQQDDAATNGPPMQKNGVIIDSLLHSFLLVGGIVVLLCFVLYQISLYLPSKSESTIKTPLLGQRQAGIIPSRNIILIAMVAVVLSSIFLRWGLAETFSLCFVWDTLPMAIVVNHYKKTKSEYVKRYTNETWGGKFPYLGRGNPTENPSAVFEKSNPHRNQCSNRGFAASHIADMMIHDRHVPIWKRAQSSQSLFCIDNVCKPHFLTVMAIMRGEKEAVVEWVDFHMQVGVDHFLLYIDETHANANLIRILLQPWTELGVITLLDGHIGQGRADKRSVEDFFQTTWWLARLDLDEFMHAPMALRVDEYLARLSVSGNLPQQLLLPRFDFGDSGWDTKPGGLITKAYDRAESFASIFKPLIFTPIFEMPGVLQKLDGNPHKFLDESIAVSCEAILWLGPFLWCPKNFPWVYFVGWSNPLSSHKKFSKVK